MAKFWLMKAEPNSRIVKGRDVKFSVDDFEAAVTTSWEGVRNPEARNLMKEMQIGDKVDFALVDCHDNVRIDVGKEMYGLDTFRVGIAGFAEVIKEAYPDYTAWDPEHPYYDPKSDETNPKWFMVDVKFISRVTHFVPYPLLREIAAGRVTQSAGIEYIGEEGIRAIKDMDLVHRGRLSVQRVQPEAWNAVEQLAAKGGWSAGIGKGTKRKEGVEEKRSGRKRKRTGK